MAPTVWCSCVILDGDLILLNYGTELGIKYSTGQRTVLPNSPELPKQLLQSLVQRASKVLCTELQNCCSCLYGCLLPRPLSPLFSLCSGLCSGLITQPQRSFVLNYRFAKQSSVVDLKGLCTELQNCCSCLYSGSCLFGCLPCSAFVQA